MYCKNAGMNDDILLRDWTRGHIPHNFYGKGKEIEIWNDVVHPLDHGIYIWKILLTCDDGKRTLVGTCLVWMKFGYILLDKIHVGKIRQIRMTLYKVLTGSEL